MQVAENLKKIESEINSVSNNHPTIIAVTKYVTIDRAKEAFEAGIRHFGENRIEGFLEKKTAIPEGIFHFIGSLQTRKVKEIINDVDYLHSLDRKSLADEIEKRADKPVKCFVQVNVAEEESKHGLSTEEVIPFIQSLAEYEHIEIVGLMTMAPFVDDEAELTEVFRTLRLLKEDVMQLEQTNAPCKELSMGMSNDYKIAVTEGATFVRIGTQLVG